MTRAAPRRSRTEPPPAVGETTAPSARKRRARNPEATVQDILNASVRCLATGGPESVNLLQVAKMARVNRSTAYEYFQTREDLLARTIEWASNQLLAAVFGDMTARETPEENIDIILRERRADDLMATNERLSLFAMQNPELCRAWLMQVLSLADPMTDPFWQVLANSNAHFAETTLFREKVDPQVLTVVTLAGAFLWPILARSHLTSADSLPEEARRYVLEFMRMMLFGVIRPEEFPELVAKVSTRRRRS